MESSPERPFLNGQECRLITAAVWPTPSAARYADPSRAGTEYVAVFRFWIMGSRTPVADFAVGREDFRFTGKMTSAPAVPGADTRARK